MRHILNLDQAPPLVSTVTKDVHDEDGNFLGRINEKMGKAVIHLHRYRTHLHVLGILAYV